MRFTRRVCKITPEFLIHLAESPGGSKESVGQEGGGRARLGLHHTVCGPLSGLGFLSKGNGSHSRLSIRGNGIYWSLFFSRTAEFAFPASSQAIPMLLAQTTDLERYPHFAGEKAEALRGQVTRPVTELERGRACTVVSWPALLGSEGLSGT